MEIPKIKLNEQESRMFDDLLLGGIPEDLAKDLIRKIVALEFSQDPESRKLIQRRFDDELYTPAGVERHLSSLQWACSVHWLYKIAFNKSYRMPYPEIRLGFRPFGVLLYSAFRLTQAVSENILIFSSLSQNTVSAVPAVPESQDVYAERVSAWHSLGTHPDTAGVSGRVTVPSSHLEWFPIIAIELKNWAWSCPNGKEATVERLRCAVKMLRESQNPFDAGDTPSLWLLTSHAIAFSLDPKFKNFNAEYLVRRNPKDGKLGFNEAIATWANEIHSGGRIVQGGATHEGFLFSTKRSDFAKKVGRDYIAKLKPKRG